MLIVIALIVGINYYPHGGDLYGCVNDAYAIKAVLDRHSDGTKNFDVNIETATGPKATISRKELKNKVEELFKDKSDIALFYFSGQFPLQFLLPQAPGFLCR